MMRSEPKAGGIIWDCRTLTSMYDLEVGGWPKWIIRLMKIFRKAK